MTGEPLSGGGEIQAPSGDDPVMAALREFLRNNFPAARQSEVSATAQLLEEGIVDSLGLLTMVEFIEDTYGFAVDGDEMVTENFGSLAALAEFIARKT